MSKIGGEMDVGKENPYSLLGKRDTDKERVTMVRSAEEQLNKLVVETVNTYDSIKRGHSRVGIGDTATDEAIAHRIYHAIHFRDIPIV